MNNINLIISGNLTGFSCFYTSSHADEIFSEAKFDFDFRNHLTFLNEREKVYAVSFAPTVIAVSLVTRVLDSFRRPGILVISILMHRNQKIEFPANSQDNKVLYLLLNEINDRFYEKCFTNGMINQNASVLMQDYYTDILNNYTLVPDKNQRSVNSNINAALINKRLGYVASTEDNAALYLSSVCRRSYEGYHHIFFSQNAPQNIEETPEETVLYSVLVKNNNYRIHSVKLSERVYNMQPDKGEIDFEKNYTYQQVLNGEAGTHIYANRQGEIIELTYRFDQEKRNINFVFKDGSNDVPFHLVAPVIKDENGSYKKIPNESYTFYGKEIFTNKKLISDNANYHIKSESSILDISRVEDGATYYVNVEQGFEFSCNFGVGSTKNKTITLRNRFSRETIEIQDVTVDAHKKLFGLPEQWEYTINSTEYEYVAGSVDALLLNNQVTLYPQKRVPAQQTFTSGSSARTESKAIDKGTPIDRGKQKIELQLIGDTSEGNKKSADKKKNTNFLLFIGVLAIVVTASIGGFVWPGWFLKNENDNEEVTTNDSIKKAITFYFVDSADKNIEKEDFDKWNNAKLIKGPWVSYNNKLDSINMEDSNELSCKYSIITNNEHLKVELKMSLKFDNFELLYEPVLLTDTTINTYKIKLNVSISELDLFTNIKKIIKDNNAVSEEQYKKLSDYRKNNNDFDEKITTLLYQIEPKKRDNSNTMELNLNVLSKWNITKGEIQKIKAQLGNHNPKIEGDVTATQRINALETMINYIRKGQRPNTDNLSSNQTKYIVSIFTEENTPKLKKRGNDFKNVKNIEEFLVAIQECGITVIIR